MGINLVKMAGEGTMAVKDVAGLGYRGVRAFINSVGSYDSNDKYLDVPDPANLVDSADQLDVIQTGER